MFYKSTKVIVTGSNVTHKAGPRIGSLGYISGNNFKQKESIANNEILLFNASVYFYRYGYEKSERLERKRVIFVAPVIREKDNLNNCFRAVKKFILSKKGDKRLFLELCPIEDNLLEDSSLSVCAKICSRLYNHNFRDALLYITTDLSCIGTYYDLNRLRKIVNVDVMAFIKKYLIFTDISKDLSKDKAIRIKQIVHELKTTFYKKGNNISNLFLLLNTLQFLEVKIMHKNPVVLPDKRLVFIPEFIVNKSYPFNTYLPSYIDLMRTLFLMYEYNAIILQGKANVQALAKTEVVKERMIQEGNKVLNLN